MYFYYLWFLISIVVLALFGYMGFWAVKHFKMILIDDESAFIGSIYRNKQDVIIQNMFLLGILYLGIYFILLNIRYGNFVSTKTIFLYTCVMSLVVAYFFKVTIVNFTGVSGIVLWWIINSWTLENKLVFRTFTYSGMIFLFIIYYIIGRLIEIYKGNLDFFYKTTGKIYTLLGAAGIAFVLCILSSIREIDIQKTNAIAVAFYEINRYWKPVLQLGLFALLAVVLLIVGILSRKIEKIEIIVESIILLLFIHYLLLAHTLIVKDTFNFAFNLLSFIYLIWIIFLGYLRKDSVFISGGIYGTLFYSFYKYYFWLESYLDKSLFFVISGIFFIYIGWLIEKFRKKLLEKI